MGGAVTNIAAVKHGLAKYDPDVIQGSRPRSRGDRPPDRALPVEETPMPAGRSSGLQPKRAEVILAGACIVRTIMEKLGQDRFTVSDRGLRHGVLAERFARGPATEASRETHEDHDATADERRLRQRRRADRAPQIGRRSWRMLDTASTASSSSSRFPATAHRTTIQGLPLDPVEAEPRQVFFFDTPKLALNQAGIVVRARRIQGGAADTVIKLRPVVPADLPASLRQVGRLQDRAGRAPGRLRLLGVLKGERDGRRGERRRRGQDASCRKLFSKEQRAFYKEHAPARAGPRRPRRARPHVPAQVAVLREKARPESHRRDVVLSGRRPASSSSRRRPSRPRRSRWRPSSEPSSESAESTSGGRAGDEDRGGAEVLQRQAARGGPKNT